jgi:pyruvate/2-oxoacid:ferredoxin oxidoreductase alpha subunit
VAGAAALITLLAGDVQPGIADHVAEVICAYPISPQTHIVEE